MPVSTGDLIAWRDALVKARLNGVRTVRDSDGSEVTYKSDNEMKAAIAAADSMIAATSPPIKTIKFTTSKGL